MNEKTLSRRDVLKALGVAPMIAGGVPSGDVLADPVVDQDAGSTPQLAIVSRHLQWADMEEAAAVAAESGYRSIAWTCRGNGTGSTSSPADAR